jgi:hypothetical protein
MTQESQPAAAGQSKPGTWDAQDSGVHSTVVGDPDHKTNQAERAAMHPDGDDFEWSYYHGAWSG